MIRQPYQANPMAWDRAQRTSHTPAESACAIEGPMPKTSTVLAAMFKWALVLIAVVGAAHFIARFA